MRDVLLSLVILVAMAQTALAGVESGLREEVETLKARLAEMEARPAAGEAATPEAADKTGQAADDPLSLEGRFGSLSLHGGGVLYYQGATAADIGGLHVGGASDAGFAADLEFTWKPLENGELLLQVHAGEGDGADRRLVERSGALVADLNTLNDDNPDDECVRVLQAFYTHAFLDGSLRVSAGKTEPLAFIDGNAFANDEAGQFVGKPFVNDPILDTENEFAPLLAVGVAPVEALELTVLVASSSRPQNEAEAKDTFERIFDTPFVAAQVAVSPDLLDREGTWRLYGWAATYERDELQRADADSPEGQEKGHGLGLSLDQQLTDVLGIFARVGYHARDVYPAPWTWALGASLTGLLQGRPDDTLGLGIAGLATRDEFLFGQQTLGGGQELHLEAYYRLAFGEHLALTPDVQYVFNPLGESDNDGVVAGMLRTEIMF